MSADENDTWLVAIGLASSLDALAAPSDPSMFYSSRLLYSSPTGIISWVAGKGESGIDLSGNGVSAESCSTSEIPAMTMSNDAVFNITDTNVLWVTVVNVSDTIKVCQGTTVIIVDESEAERSMSNVVEIEIGRLSSGPDLP